MKPVMYLLLLIALFGSSCSLLKPEEEDGKLRVKVTDQQGNVVEGANIYIVWNELIPHGKFNPPNPDVFLSTQITPEQKVRVFWGCISETGITGYIVLRSDFPDASNLQVVGSGTFIEHIPGCVIYEEIDQNVVWGKVYYYYVHVYGPDMADLGLTAPSEAILANPTDPGLPTDWDLTTINAAFSGAQLLRFQLPESGKCRIRIHNSYTDNSFDIVDDILSAGYHQLIWDGKDDLGYDVPNGIYRVELHSFDAQQQPSVRKTIFLLKNNRALTNLPVAVSNSTPLDLTFDKYFLFDTPLALYNPSTQQQITTTLPYFFSVHVTKDGFETASRSITITSMKKVYLASVVLTPD